LIGVVLMALATAMMLATSAKFWNDAGGFGSAADYVKDGKQSDVIAAVFDAGFIVSFIGSAIIAFGLASTHAQAPQYRQVETMIPPMQYPPQQPRQ